MDSVRGLYCMFIKMTSAPPCAGVSTPSSSAVRKSSGSIRRMASTVPVCQITKSGFSSTSNFAHAAGQIRGGLPGPDQGHDLDRDTRKAALLSAASSRAG